MTLKSRPIAATFTTITASQLALGIYLIFLTATHPCGSWAFNRSFPTTV